MRKDTTIFISLLAVIIIINLGYEPLNAIFESGLFSGKYMTVFLTIISVVTLGGLIVYFASKYDLKEKIISKVLPTLDAKKIKNWLFGKTLSNNGSIGSSSEYNAELEESLNYLNNNPFLSPGDKRNFAVGLLKEEDTILRSYVACSKKMPEEYRAHYNVLLERYYGDIPVSLCQIYEKYYFPIMGDFFGNGLEFFSLNADIEMYRARGYNVIDYEKLELDIKSFSEQAHDSKRNACTEKQILNQVYQEYKDNIHVLKNYKLEIFSDMAKCRSCADLIKLENEKFVSEIEVSYDDSFSLIKDKIEDEDMRKKLEELLSYIQIHKKKTKN